MMAKPLVSVVMATFGRGRHILPSIRSVLQQSVQQIELIVVGDYCIDGTEEVVRRLEDDRVSWYNLPERWHSQSGPNNAGIAAARGSYIAYIGHDDIWNRDHVQNLLAVFEGPETPDFAIGGAIWHMPPGVNRPRVTGMFEAPSDAAKHFFPPSSVSHRTEAFIQVGPWSRPADIREAVDVDFQHRAVAAGLKYASTGQISVHKFAAAMRYLSYLRQSSEEQEAMLQAMEELGFGRWIETQVNLAKEQEGFMDFIFANQEHLDLGQSAKNNLAHKGAILPPLVPMLGGIGLPQKRGNFGYDWSDVPDGQTRWVGFNPNPKWLLNVTGGGDAQIVTSVAHDARVPLKEIEIEGPEVRDIRTGPSTQTNEQLALTRVRFKVRLSTSDYTVITFRLTPEQTRSENRMGIGLTTFYVLPADVDQSIVDDLGRLAGLTANQAELTTLRRERESLSQVCCELTDSRVQLNEMSDELKSTREKLVGALAAAETIGARFEAIENSTSWRATAFLRWILIKWRARQTEIR